MSEFDDEIAELREWRDQAIQVLRSVRGYAGTIERMRPHVNGTRASTATLRPDRTLVGLVADPRIQDFKTDMARANELAAAIEEAIAKVLP